MDVSSAKQQAGFTLLEFIYVMLVAAILSVMAYLQFTPASNINLGGQAKQLANDIRYTQSLAMTKGQRYYLIKQSSTTYQIMNAAGSAITLPMGGTTLTLNNGITFGTWTNLPNNLIAFDGNGTPYSTSSSPGTALNSTATIALTANSVTRTVSIAAQTGEVTVQ